MHSARLSLVSSSKILNPVEQVKPVAHAKESYGFVSTRELITVFERKGWEVEKIQRSNVRKADKEGFQRHMIWLKNASFPTIEGLSKNNETSPRLCLVNAHDLSSKLHIFLGGLRIACLNQILAGNVFRYFGATHSKNVVSRLSDGIDYMSEGIPELIENLKRLQSIQMNSEQRFAYARKLVDMRLVNVQNVVRVDYSRTEHAIRGEDTEQDAYTVMNRVQEYVVRGGIPYTYEKSFRNDAGEVVETRLVSTHTRKLASIPAQLRLNQALLGEIYNVVGENPAQGSGTLAEAA